MIITPAQLTSISPGLKGRMAINVAEGLTQICPIYGINTYDIVHEFLANLLHECQEFTRFEENLNYSVKGLIKTFGRHRISLADANLYGRIDGKRPANKQMIANIIYGGKWGKLNLGNDQPNDGWLLRGSGAMQCTGRWVIGGFTDHYNKAFKTNYTIFEMAALLRTDYKISIHGASWFFAVFKGLIPAAVADRDISIARAINGGTLGLEERRGFLQRAQQILV